MNQIDGNDDLDWEDERDPDWDENDPWECVLGAECLVPHYFHRSSERYSVETALAWQEEQEKEARYANCN